MAYASKYYDPVKAHQYYMEHRQLKGRRRTKASLNDKGKEAIDYIKAQLQKERDAKKAEIKSQKERSLEQLKERKKQTIEEVNRLKEVDREKLKDQLNRTVDRLQALVKTKGLSQEKKAEIRASIKEIRAKYSEDGKAITAKYKGMRKYVNDAYSNQRKGITAKAKEGIQKANDEYKEKYNAEFDRLAADSSFAKKKKK